MADQQSVVTHVLAIRSKTVADSMRVKNHPEYAERLNRPANHRDDSKSKNEIGRSLAINCNADVESVPYVTSPCIVALNGLKGIAELHNAAAALQQIFG